MSDSIPFVHIPPLCQVQVDSYIYDLIPIVLDLGDNAIHTADAARMTYTY